MKAWILHDSYYGNGEKLANLLKEIFSKEIKDIKVGHVKNTSPEQVAKDKPDLIVLGAAVRQFTISPMSRKWFDELNVQLKESNFTIKYAVGFITHWLRLFAKLPKNRRFLKFIGKESTVESVYPVLLTAKVATTKGPFDAGVLELIEKQANDILDWIKN